MESKNSSNQAIALTKENITEQLMARILDNPEGYVKSSMAQGFSDLSPIIEDELSTVGDASGWYQDNNEEKTSYMLLNLTDYRTTFIDLLSASVASYDADEGKVYIDVELLLFTSIGSAIPLSQALYVERELGDYKTQIEEVEISEQLVISIGWDDDNGTPTMATQWIMVNNGELTDGQPISSKAFMGKLWGLMSTLRTNMVSSHNVIMETLSKQY